MRIIAEKENEKLHDKSISELKGYPFFNKDIIATNRKIDQNSVLPDAKTFLKELKALKGDSTAYS